MNALILLQRNCILLGSRDFKHNWENKIWMHDYAFTIQPAAEYIM